MSRRFISSSPKAKARTFDEYHSSYYTAAEILPNSSSHSVYQIRILLDAVVFLAILVKHAESPIGI